MHSPSAPSEFCIKNPFEKISDVALNQVEKIWKKQEMSIVAQETNKKRH